MNKLIAVLRLTRIEHSIMLVIAVLAAELIARGLPGAQILVLSLITPIFVSMGAFAINDYYDIEVDKLNKKKRPLTTNSLKPRDAFNIAIASFLIGVVASAFINTYCFVIALAFAVLSFLYSYKLKEIAFWGNADIALSMAIPFLYGNYVVIDRLSLSIMLVFAMIFLSGIAREIHGTIRDYEGDTKIRKAHTLPSKIGMRIAASLSMLLYIAAIAISIYLFLYVRPFAGNIAYAVLIALSDLMILYVAIGFIAVRNQSFYDKTRNISLAAMSIALIALLISPLV